MLLVKIAEGKGGSSSRTETGVECRVAAGGGWGGFGVWGLGITTDLGDWLGVNSPNPKPQTRRDLEP